MPRSAGSEEEVAELDETEDEHDHDEDEEDGTFVGSAGNASVTEKRVSKPRKVSLRNELQL